MTTENFPTETIYTYNQMMGESMHTRKFLENKMIELEFALANSHKVLESVNTEMSNLQKTYSDALNTIRVQSQRLESFKEEVKQFVLDNLGGHIDDDDLRSFAESFGIPMTQTISFSVSTVFHCTAEVPLGTDLDELESTLEGNFSLSIDYNGDDVQDFDYEYPDTEVHDVEVA